MNKTYIVPQRDDWKPGDCYICRFTCAAKHGINPVCPMLESKEAVEVTTDEMETYEEDAHMGYQGINGERVTLYAVKGTK